MRSECIQAVSRALGRNATQQETHDIENRLRLSMRKLASEDPDGWQALPRDERLQRAGADAAKDLTREAALKRHRVAKAILAHDRINNYVESQVASGFDKDGIAALRRMLVSESDGKNNISSVEGMIHGIMADAGPRLTRSWDVIGGRFLHMLRDSEAEAMLVRALHGATDVPKPFIDAADDFHKAADILRKRFNAAGGAIGKLDNWGMPHSWADHLLLRAGKQKWTDAMLPLMDRSKYTRDDGSRYSDQEMREFLGNAWQTVVTDGANKTLRGERIGNGIKANRGNQGRQIHLSGPESFLKAQSMFSDRGVMDAMMRHIHSLARNIALVETFGPNADRTFAHALEQEASKAIVSNPAKKGTITKNAQFTERLYNYLAGNGTPPPDTLTGKSVQTWRNLQILKLGKVLITALTDKGPMWMVMHANGIPIVKAFLNEIRLLAGVDRKGKAIAASGGLMIREYSQSLARFGSDIGAYGWSSKLGNTMMKVSGVSHFWDSERKAVSIGLMDQVGKALAEHEKIANLGAADQRFLKHSGISESDWQLMRLAKLEDWGGNHHIITPEAIHRIPNTMIANLTKEDPDIARSRASANLMAFVLGEQDRAVLEPDAVSHVLLQADRPITGLADVLPVSFRMFKSYPTQMYRAHFIRALRAFDSQSSSVGYMATLLATTTMLGAAANAIDDIVDGRDPRTLNIDSKQGWKNWGAALAKGGGLSIYGDLLINTAGSEGRNTLAETLAGPMVGDAAKLINAGQQVVASSTDPDADMLKKLRPTGASTINAIKPYFPGANLWYTQAAFNHLLFDQLANYFSPGYLERMKERARRQDRSYWWQPDQALPQRAPDLSHVDSDR